MGGRGSSSSGGAASGSSGAVEGTQKKLSTDEIKRPDVNKNHEWTISQTEFSSKYGIPSGYKGLSAGEANAVNKSLYAIVPDRLSYRNDNEIKEVVAYYLNRWKELIRKKRIDEIQKSAGIIEDPRLKSKMTYDKRPMTDEELMRF